MRWQCYSQTGWNCFSSISCVGFLFQASHRQNSFSTSTICTGVMLFQFFTPYTPCANMAAYARKRGLSVKPLQRADSPFILCNNCEVFTFCESCVSEDIPTANISMRRVSLNNRWINTMEAFQGQHVSLIIQSCVRRLFLCSCIVHGRHITLRCT